jgi:DNA primase
LLSSNPEAWAGKIFLDYLRNGRGNTGCRRLFAAGAAGISGCGAGYVKAGRERCQPDAFAMKSPFKARKLS